MFTSVKNKSEHDIFVYNVIKTGVANLTGLVDFVAQCF